MTAGTSPVNLDSLYQEIILDHYRAPHRAGLREPYDAEVHHVNPTCGDEVTLRVRLVDGVVQDVSYDAEGCSISQAATSVLTDLVTGKPVGVAKFPARIKCALLGWMAWKDATAQAVADAEVQR